MTSEIDKDLSERYRAGASEEPPEQLDASILAAAKRAVASQPRSLGAPRTLRRWYVPVSLAAVIMLSVIVTLRIEREQPELAPPEAAPVGREKVQKPVQQEQPALEQRTVPPAEVALRAAPKSAPAQAVTPPAAPGFAADSKARRDAPSPPAAREEIAADSGLARDAAPAPQASAEAASGRIAENAIDRSAGARREARAMPAPSSAAPQTALAKRELAPEEWLERIADLRKQGRDKEADEQFAEFRRRFPEFRISEPMMERIGPRK